jgi:hypothetical protein
MLLIGFLTVWATVYQIVSLVVVTTIFISQSLNPSPEMLSTTTFFQALKPLNLFMFLLSIILMVFFTFNVAKSPTHKNRDRLWYIVGIWILPYIVMPVYYVQHIWNARPDDKYTSNIA